MIRKLIVISIVAIALPFAVSAQSSRYGNWQQGGVDSKALLKDLQKMIDEAERARAADPRFIKDLRSLVRRYGNPWQVSLLKETFSDGDYTRNPAWTVASGRFEASRQGGLTSDVAIYRSSSSERSDSKGDVAVQLLGALLNKNRKQDSGSYERGPAEIYLPLKISNSFSLTADFGGRGEGGAFEFRVYQGKRRLRGYVLAYSDQAGLTLMRRYRGSEVVVKAVRPKQSLLDGVEHKIGWTRARDGEMAVSIDDKEIFRIVDLGLTDPFEGIRMVNGGGQQVLFGLRIDGTK